MRLTNSGKRNERMILNIIEIKKAINMDLQIFNFALVLPIYIDLINSDAAHRSIQLFI